MNLIRKTIASTNRGLSVREATDLDITFLRQLYGTTRASEMAMISWDDSQKMEFLDQQFNAQHTFYTEQFKQAEFGIVIKNSVDIGRLYLDQRESELRIIDIALMPNYQKMGIGKAILKAVQSQAHKLGLPITIHVETNNPAMKLYQKLGFQFIEDQGVYHLMRWGRANDDL